MKVSGHLYHLSAVVKQQQQKIRNSIMSWPYSISFLDPSQYMNGITNLCQPFYHNEFTSNQLLKPMTPAFYNITQNYNIYASNCLALSTGGLGEQNNQQMRVNNENAQVDEQSENEEKKSEQSNLNQINESSFQAEEIKMVRFRRRRKIKKAKNTISHNSSLRNDTKNIPKNYGKAMLAYIQKNSRQSKQLLAIHDVDYMEFMMTVKSFKSKINTIHDLRQMWGEDSKEDKVKKCIRILSYHFMRKKCLPYIFNSRVKNYHTHIKYRKKIIQGIENPQKFTKIKEF